jgi:hypothetical protein
MGKGVTIAMMMMMMEMRRFMMKMMPKPLGLQGSKSLILLCVGDGGDLCGGYGGSGAARLD